MADCLHIPHEIGAVDHKFIALAVAGGAGSACKRNGPIGCNYCGDVFQLVELFGTTRDAWIEEDLQGWLAPNRIYPGVPDVLRALLDRQETYIVTTKQVPPTPRTPPHPPARVPAPQRSPYVHSIA